MQVLGTPTREEIKCMNPNYTEFKFPQIKAHPWHKVVHIGWTVASCFNCVILCFFKFIFFCLMIRYSTNACIQKLVIWFPDCCNILQTYDAQLWVHVLNLSYTGRLTSFSIFSLILLFLQLDALTHPFFDELRDRNARLPNGRFLPPLFNFKPHGMIDFLYLIVWLYLGRHSLGYLFIQNWRGCRWMFKWN